MNILLNESLNIDLIKGLNIIISTDAKSRNIVLSAFSTWFKTGIKTLEDTSINIYKDSIELRKNEFDLICVSPGIEDYLGSRSTKTLITKQLLEFSHKIDIIDSDIKVINKLVEELGYKINNQLNNKYNYEFTIDDDFDKNLLQLFEFSQINPNGMIHDIYESKRILIDLMMTKAKKKETIIFIPYLSLALTNNEVLKLLNFLRDLNVYVVLFDSDKLLIELSKSTDNTKYLINENFKIRINDIYKEIQLIWDQDEEVIMKNIAIICDNYSSAELMNYELIKSYTDNKFL